MDIRPATLNDVPHVLPLVKRICDLHQKWDALRFGFKDNVEKIYEPWLKERTSDPRSVFLVCEHDDKIIAYVVCTIEPEIPVYWMPECGWVHDLWVDADYRNEGIGRQMAMLVVERFKQLKVAQIRLQTAVANEVGRKLFSSVGFRNATVEMLCDLT